MYKYLWDDETGGILLTPAEDHMQMEIRPVYSPEMDLLGFDQFWEYEKSTDRPIMWAQNREYYYRGELLFEEKKGVSIDDDLIYSYINRESFGKKLEFIDMQRMLEKNRELMESLIKDSLNILYTVWKKCNQNYDLIIVNYSGGKDSCVVLDLAKRILPVGSYKVYWTNAGMEYSDTLELIKHEQERCRNLGIEFLVGETDHDALALWKKIGPPAMKNRWCCHVQKSTLADMKLKAYLKKSDFTELSFQGIRIREGGMREVTESYFIKGKKSDNVDVCNPILEWNSAEVYLYHFMRNLEINKAYKNGARRIGCSVCPMAVNEPLAMKRYCREEQAIWKKAIKDIYPNDYFIDGLDAYESGSWRNRIGSAGTLLKSKYREYIEDDALHIEFENPTSDYRTWMKTIGKLDTCNHILFRNKEYEFTIVQNQNHYHVILSQKEAMEDFEFVKLFKYVFRKACYCVGCKICENGCPHGFIQMRDGIVSISDECRHCSACHSHSKDGCVAFGSQQNFNEII